MAILLAVLLVFQISLASTEKSLTKILYTTSGPVRGEAVKLSVNKTVIRYLGIPYCGAKRFEQCQEVKWTKVLEATTPGKPCPQPSSIFGVENVDETSEECQNLNIYVSGDSPSRNLPVMVLSTSIFHSFGSALKIVDGVSVVARGTSIVLVVIDYRLGIFGFLSSKPSNIKGNFGLRDKITALKWVHHNIQRFGGNPNDVTLVGQSSAAMDVGLLLVSPQAQGLFKRAILMSGSPLSPLATVDQSTAALNSRAIGEYFKCANDSVIKECLATKSAQEIMFAQQTFLNKPILMPFGPVIDHDILPDSPENLFKTKKPVVSSVLLGVLEADGDIFRIPLPGITDKALPIKQGVSESALFNIIQESEWSRRGVSPQAIKYKYTDWNEPKDATKTSQKLTELYTDSAFTSPAVRLADLLSKGGVETFFYQIKREGLSGSSGIPHRDSVTHGNDIREMFAQRSFNESMRNVMDELFDMWMSFVKTGEPSNALHENPRWPAYTPNGHFLTIATNITLQSKLLPDRVAFWNNLLPSMAMEQLANNPTPTLLTTTSSHDNENNCINKKDNTKALTAVVAVMAIVIIVMLSIIIYQVRILSKRHENAP